MASNLVRQGVWLIGGDGWAYDIGFGGLDHVLSSGRNVNILVLDTEVYSNTGGQASKATQRGAVAKFAAAGKSTGKKDLGAIARAYGNVYVAQISMGANELQATKALVEADAWPGPSLVIAYSTCIAHGIDMSKSMTHQKDAVKSGYWPLYRFQPSEIDDGQPFKLDSKAPSIPVRDFVATETRYAILERTDPARARQLSGLLQADIDERWRYYEQLASMHRTASRTSTTSATTSTPRSRTTPATGTRARTWHDRPHHPLPRPRPAHADRGLGVAAQRRAGDRRRWSRTPAPPRSSCPPCSRRRSCTRRSSSTARSRPGSEHFAEALDYFPDVGEYASAGDRYLAKLEALKAQSSVPIIASLNASSAGGWVRHASLIEQAGADALELNLYHVAADPARDAADMEAADLGDRPVRARARCRSRWR